MLEKLTSSKHIHKFLTPQQKKQKQKIKIQSGAIQIPPFINVLELIEDDLQKDQNPAITTKRNKFNSYKAKFLKKKNIYDLKPSIKTFSVGSNDLVNQWLKNFGSNNYLNNKNQQEQRATIWMSNSTEVIQVKIKPVQQIRVGVYPNNQKQSKNSHKKNQKKKNSNAIYDKSMQQTEQTRCKKCQNQLTIENESTGSQSSTYLYCYKCKERTS